MFWFLDSFFVFACPAFCPLPLSFSVWIHIVLVFKKSLCLLFGFFAIRADVGDFGDTWLLLFFLFSIISSLSLVSPLSSSSNVVCISIFRSLLSLSCNEVCFFYDPLDQNCECCRPLLAIVSFNFYTLSSLGPVKKFKEREVHAPNENEHIGRHATDTAWKRKESNTANEEQRCSETKTWWQTVITWGAQHKANKKGGKGNWKTNWSKNRWSAAWKG